MIPNPEEERQIKLYLLGDLAEEERQKFEERIFFDDDLVNQLMLVEDELVDDYVQGYLSERERALFKQNYLKAPDRMRKVTLTTHLIKHATKTGDSDEAGVVSESQPSEWRRVLFAPRWRAAAISLILIITALATWRLFFHKPPVNKALAALNQAYRNGRPVEPRITGFTFAEFKSSDQRGGKPGQNDELKTDFVALERAKNLLFGSDINMSDPSVLHALGRFYLTQKEFNRAIDLLQKALLADPNNPQLHSDLGAAVLARIEQDRSTKGDRNDEDVEEALKQLNQALSLDPSLLEALFNRALLYEGERLRRQALDDWQRYRQLDPNSPWGAEALEHLQEVERSLKKVSRRNEQLYQDFIKAQQNGDEAKALEIFGLSYSYNGNYIVRKLVDDFLEAKHNGRPHEAKEKLEILSQIGRLSETRTNDRFTADQARYYAQAQPEQLAIIKQAHETMTQADSLVNEQSDGAVEKYEQARRLFESAGNLGASLFAEARIGHCYHMRSDTTRNLQVFTRLVPVNTEKRYLWMEANAYCGLANADDSSGRFSEAMDDSRRCGELSKRVGDQAGLMRSLILRGIFSQSLGKHHESLRISQQGLELSERFSAEPQYEIGFLQNSSRSLGTVGLFDAARAFQFEAVKLAAKTDSPRLKSRSHVYLGLIYEKWKRYDEAISSIQQGITIGRQLGGDKTGQEIVHYGLLHLANVYREAGKFTEALQAYDQIIDFFNRSGREIYLYAGLKGRLLTFIAKKDDRAAKAEIDQVIKLYERYRKSIQEESSRNSFFDQEQGIYDVAIDFAYSNLKDSKQALAYSELCRARSLLDASKRGWKTIDGPELPDLKIDAGAIPAGPDEIQRQMPDPVQIVEYAVVNDKFLIWVISKTKVASRTVAIPQSELTTRVNRYLELIRQPPGTDDQRWREQAADLYDLFIRPIAPLLDREKQLCIIPDKILSRLPFETLIQRKSGNHDADKLLTEEFKLIYASSANVFLGSCEKARQRSRVQKERILAVGNPDFFQNDFPTLSKLPSAEREAVAIATFYQAPVLLVNGQARKNSVMQEIGRSDVVHLALHYETNSWSPMLSRMPMASTVAGDTERAIYLYELYQYKSLQPRLVVLSGCQTTAEDYLGGEGPIGVSRPLTAAGIPLVVASLWPVDTNTTSDLMIEFHRQRKEGKHSTVEALGLAQQTFYSRKDKYRHPYYWAAFITVGGYSEY